MLRILVSLPLAVCLALATCLLYAADNKIEGLTEIADLEGPWLMEGNGGKTVFQIKKGKIEGLPCTFEIKNGLLTGRMPILDKTFELKEQEDGNWVGKENPGGNKITLTKYKPPAKFPKKISDLDGAWALKRGGGELSSMKIKTGKIFDASGKIEAKIQMQNGYARITSLTEKGVFADVFLLDDGVWVGVITPNAVALSMTKM